MLRSIVAALLNDGQKRVIRSRVNAAKKRWANAFRSYDSDALKLRLREMGVVETDTLMVHANFRADSGFQGSPNDVVSALIELVGEHGNLMMVTIPFRGFARDYLAKNRPFNVNKTISMMGLVTEMFRRRKGAVRSLHPTHPVVAYGRDSMQIIAGHEMSLYPTGEGTPFEMLRELDGKILFFDVGFGAVTLFHHIEHLLREALPFQLYDEQLFEARVIDKDGQEQIVKTYAFATGVIRHQAKLEDEMLRCGQLQRGRIGNSTLILVRARDVVDTMTEMVQSGEALLERAAL